MGFGPGLGYNAPMTVLRNVFRYTPVYLLGGFVLLAVACGRVGPPVEERGPGMVLRMEDVELRAYLGDQTQFVFHAARMWLDEVEGRLRVEEVHGQLEPICFEEVRP